MCGYPCFEGSQCHDQFGLRPGTGVEHALLIFDPVTEKSLEFGFGFWMASLDLRKAFDKIRFVCSTPPTRTS